MRKITICVTALAGALFVLPFLMPVSHSGRFLATSMARAAEPYSYGDPKSGKYGEKREVGTVSAAEALLKEYYAKQNVTIGTIREKERYFEAEILDAKGAVTDTVIIDKRTGRIRSIY